MPLVGAQHRPSPSLWPDKSLRPYRELDEPFLSFDALPDGGQIWVNVSLFTTPMTTLLPRLIGLGLAFLLFNVTGFAQSSAPLVLRSDSAGRPESITRAAPLDRLTVLAPAGSVVEVRDGAKTVYFRGSSTGQVAFQAGGALGEQQVLVRDAAGRETGRSGFVLEAETAIDDGGRFHDMFALFRRGMNSDMPTGVGHIEWNNQDWHFFASWVLDHFHTMKGMKYFSPVGAEFPAMMKAAQREDGMIWSRILDDNNAAYYKTCYGPFGYVRQYGDRYFVRQPTENHPEYIYVSTLYSCWKATGDDVWLKQYLDSAQRALAYTMQDPARWSNRFQLLKRVYTIDSWDFQVDDAYTPKLGLTDTMLIDPVKSKFGVFFGDNTHYAAACEELAEMLAHTGDAAHAAQYRERAQGIRTRLDALSWNGRFFTHFIDEDSSVKRDLGVDEKTQIAQGNAYSLNRGIGPDHARAIIQTYLDLKAHLPVGSPGEWYAIYPPFGKGFGLHDQTWQYMNGGVGGHVAGELARGAFENGYEAYGVDILERLTALGHKHGDKIWFSYTGSIPPAPPPAQYTPVSLAGFANMDLTDQGGPGAAPWMQQGKPGDDIRGLPTGAQVFAGIPFTVTDPATNQRKAVVAVSRRPGLAATVEIPLHRQAGSIYLLHTSSKPTSENVCGSVAFLYEDGTRAVQYLLMGKQLTYWWFSELKTDTSGIAWHGPSPVADDVGLSWCVLDNPHPEKPIRALAFQSPEDDGIYALAGLTVADRPHYLPPNPISFGGPDDWAAATAMAALIEGLAGVKDGPNSEAYAHPLVSPRWSLTETEHLKTVVRYAASQGYVAYTYAHNPSTREISLTITGSGNAIDCHLALPAGPAAALTLLVDGMPTEHRMPAAGSTPYVDFTLRSGGPQSVVIKY